MLGAFAMTSLVAQTVKHLPTVRETWVRSLGQEDPLEKEMATHSSTLTWNYGFKAQCYPLHINQSLWKQTKSSTYD